MPLISREIANRILSSRTRKEQMSRARQFLSAQEGLDTRQIVEAWAVIGECYMYDKKPELSEQAYLKAIEAIQILGDEKLLAEGYSDLGFVWYFNKSFSSALTYYRLSADIYGRLDETEELITVLSQMAYSYSAMEKREEERDCLNTAMRQPNIHPEVKATLMERVALSLGAGGEYEKAIEVYEQALSLYESADYKRYWEERLHGLSQFYHAIGDEEGAQRTMARL